MEERSSDLLVAENMSGRVHGFDVEMADLFAEYGQALSGSADEPADFGSSTVIAITV